MLASDDLDHVYASLCHAMARVGEAQAPLFLGMLCLALLARQAEPAEALAAIEQAERRCT